ncbi:hypothetical protein MP228_012857 [Amoeboaphelidium protococcarum]|nr:hypothetical protein MP228_012857 [Amoeboaphelidium protococcarum]
MPSSIVTDQKVNKMDKQIGVNTSNSQKAQQTYDMKVKDAQRILTKSSDLLAGSHSYNTSDRQQEGDGQALVASYRHRYHTVLECDYQQALLHLAEFMRVYVVLNTVSSDTIQSGTQETKLSVVVKRNSTVEQLCTRIEAEYAFNNLSTTINSSDAQEDQLITSLKVLVLADSGQVPLKFSAGVNEVLNTGDTVYVYGLYHGTAGSETFDQLEQNFEQEYNNLLQFHTKNASDLSQVKVNLLAVLHNLQLLSHFQEFCMKDFEIEHLLFWLEVEVFKNLCQIAGSSSDGSSINTNSDEYTSLVLHARYIYFTFLSQKSSLRLNLPVSEFHSLQWPIPHVDSVTGLQNPLNTELYDRLHYRVFQYLKQFVYPKFVQSPLYGKMLDAAKQNPEEFKDSNFLPGQHYLKFQQDVEGMKNAVVEALAQGAGNVVAFNVADGVDSGSPTAKKYAYNASRSELLDLNSAGDMVQMRPKVKSSGSESGARVKFVRRTSEAFYGNGPKLTIAQKARRIQREKRLKKFFGDKPMDQAVQNVQVEEMRSRLSSSNSTASQVQASSTSDSQSIDVSSVNQGVNSGNNKVKKVGKLEDFFGVDRLPPEQLFEQHLIDRIESSHTKESKEMAKVPPPMKNELDVETKRKFIATSRKLKGVFGEMPNEDLIAHSIQPRQGGGDRLNQSRGLESARISPSIDAISFLSTDTGSTSLVNISDRVKQIRDVKDYRRKKLEKIQQFLGERISLAQIAPETRATLKNLSSKDRQVYFRRANKLQSMFGEVVPSDVMASNVLAFVPEEKDNVDDGDVVNDEYVLLYLLSDERNLTDLVEMMEDFERAEGGNHHDNGDNSEDDVLAEGGEDSSLMKTFKTARQRKRVGKLTRFFGETSGQISTELTVEDKMLVDLSRHLQDVIHPVVIGSLIEKLQSASLTANNSQGNTQSEVIQEEN